MTDRDRQWLSMIDGDWASRIANVRGAQDHRCGSPVVGDLACLDDQVAASGVVA